MGGIKGGIDPPGFRIDLYSNGRIQEIIAVSPMFQESLHLILGTRSCFRLASRQGYRINASVFLVVFSKGMIGQPILQHLRAESFPFPARSIPGQS